MSTRVSLRETEKVAAAPPPPSQTIDVDRLLSSTTKKKDQAKPRVGSDSRIAQLAAEYLKFKEAEKEAMKMANIRRDDVVALVRPEFYKACESKGESLPSVNCGKVKVTFTSNYSAIPFEELDGLAEAFGPDFDRFFREDSVLTIKTDDSFALVRELAVKLGEDYFEKHFETKRVLKVNPILHSEFNTNPVVRAQVQPFIENGIIKPYSPSIKLD